MSYHRHKNTQKQNTRGTSYNNSTIIHSEHSEHSEGIERAPSRAYCGGQFLPLRAASSLKKGGL